MLNFGKNLRHAYAVSGEPESVRVELWKIFEDELGVATRGNPDFFYQKFVSLGIDEACYVKELAGNRPFVPGGKKIFVIEADSITDQAQNALLKIFEEPSPNTHFFIIGRSSKNLIPTLAGRVATVRSTGLSGKTGEKESLAEEFIRVSRMERIALVKKFSQEIKDEKRTKADAVALLHEIEEILYQKTKRAGKLPEQFFEELEICRDYMGDPSASVKMLLDYVALAVPEITYTVE